METSPFNNPGAVQLLNCDNINKFVLPAGAKILADVELCNLPLLENVDLSNMEFIGTLLLGGLPKVSIQYFDYSRWNDFNCASLGITEEMYNDKATKAFIDKYNEHLEYAAFPSITGLTYYKWKDAL